MSKRRHLLTLLAVALTAVLSACSGSASTELAVSGAWARPAPEGASVGVAYFELTVDTPDAVTEIRVDPSLASEVQLHTAIDDSGDAAGHIHNAPSAAKGDAANPFAATPERPLTLRPDGSHAMLMGLKRSLTVGETFDMTVVLKSGREVQVEVQVATNSPINPSN